MLSKIKKPVSILLVFMMVVSLFAVVPITASAAEETITLNSSSDKLSNHGIQNLQGGNHLDFDGTGLPWGTFVAPTGKVFTKIVTNGAGSGAMNWTGSAERVDHNNMFGEWYIDFETDTDGFRPFTISFTLADAEDKAVKNVIDLINALPAAADVTVADKDQIESARAAYDALTDDQKAQIDSAVLAKLTAAETALTEAIDQDAADAVTAKINALPTDVTAADKVQIEAARAAYDALTDDQKVLVTNLDKLTAAETALAKATADKAAADTVITQINALPADAEITAADKAQIETARAAYNLLTDDQKALVTNLDKLTAAETALAKATADKAAADAVTAQINALPADVTVNDKDQIEAARAAYDALTDDQKVLVTNETLDKLTAAETALAKATADKAAADDVTAQINALPADVTVNDKDQIEAVRAAYDALTDDQKVLVINETLDKLTAAETALAKATADKAAADAVITQINALPADAEITAADKAKIESARAAYNALTDDQKALVTNETLDKLTAAETALAKATADKAAADDVTAQINALPADVTVNDKDQIEAVRAAYDALTDAQKAFISDETLAKLEAAEDALISEPVNLSYVENGTDAICLGDEVTVCGAAEGGKGEYTYAFYYKKSSSTKWLEMAPAYTTKSASCTPAAMVHYDIKTVVKDARGVTTEKILTFKVKKPLSNDSTVSAEAIELGGDIVVTGAASGGTKGYTYAFYYKKSSRSNWHEMAEPYTTDSASCKLAATINYDIKVIVKDANGRTEEKTFTVKVNGPLVNKSEVVTTNAKVGEKISVKGAASGGAGGYTYAFYYKKSSKTDWYAMAPAYTRRHAAFTPAAAVSYDVKVIVKDADGNTEEVIYTVDVSK